MRATFTGPGYVLELERELIDYSTRGHYELAPKWRHVDPAGHPHTSLDSLVWTVTGSYWCEECWDEHDEGEYRCQICGAAVEPDYTFTGPDTYTLPGLTTATLQFADGRSYRLLPDEMRMTAWPPSEEWLAQVTARDPDTWVFG